MHESWYMAGEIVTAVHSYEDEEREVRGNQGLLTDVLAMGEQMAICKEAPELLHERLTKAKAAGRLGLNPGNCQTLIAESAGELAALRDALGH